MHALRTATNPNEIPNRVGKQIAVPLGLWGLLIEIRQDTA